MKRPDCVEDQATNRRGRSIAAWLTLASLVATAGAYWQAARQWIPGQWPGDQGIVLISPVWTGLALLLFASALSAMAALRQRGRMLALVAITVTPCLIPVGRFLGPDYRFAAERSAYASALRTGKPFGDQYGEVVDGRKLTYWRWVKWDIDNAVGVIYDPADRLTDDPDGPDLRAFSRPTGGVLFKVVRKEPHWFLVHHS